jgi:L,D-transpeptidase catalytic domain/Putative peptidoglycan binding domain
VLALFFAGSSTASAATVTIQATPAIPVYGQTVTFSGKVTPAAAGQQVKLFRDVRDGAGYKLLASTTTRADGTYAIRVTARSPGSYATEAAGSPSPAIVLKLKPRLLGRVRGLRYPGLRMYLRGRVRPAAAGALKLHIGTRTRSVRVRADGRYAARLPTKTAGRHRARLELVPRSGYTARKILRHYRIRTPSLAIGSYGTGVLALERRLHRLRYAVGSADRFYGVHTYEAVLAFQKVHRMSRTGRVGDTVWAKLGRAHIPKARHPSGAHIEVDKTRQVLFEVRKGQVVRVIHVSTGATGNTPVGTWHVYWKQAGLNSHGMYYSLYWYLGFAIHGYASVPAWPASHGCVRIPMWLAHGLYSRWGLGTTVYVYYS